MNPTAEGKKSKKTVTIILVISAFLAIASIITGYYYLQIKDIAPQDTNASNGCGCYFVAANDSIQSCTNATTKSAYEFRTGTTETNGNCSAICDPNTAAATTISNQTILSCKVSDFPINPGCVDISIEDAQQQRYANNIPLNQTLNIKAKFTTPGNYTGADDYYKSFSFLINGEKTEVSLDQAVSSGEGKSKEYLISTQLSGYESADSVSIQAFGQNNTGDDVTSSACNRVLKVEKEQVSACTQLNAEIVNDTSGTPKVNEITVATSSLDKASTLSIKFTVGGSNTIITTKNISSLLQNNRIVLDKTFLYTKSNFVDNQSFSVLDNEVSNISLSGEIYVNGTAIQSISCGGVFDIPVFVDNTERDTTEDTGADNQTNDQTDNTDNNNEQASITDTETSDFSVSKISSVSCIERVSPSNSVNYTITITNNDTDTEDIVRVEDKLPLGFEYTDGSTFINGSLVDDDGTVSVTTVGSSQQITFTTGSNWSLGPNEGMTIKYNAKASTSALSGDNLNEVVVVPVNNPLNSSSLRTSNQITVAQSCTAPQTGLFDTTLSKVILSIFVIFLGMFIYFSQSGILFSEKVLTSPLAQSLRLWKLKNDNPTKYFEDKFIKEIEKKRNN